MTATAQLTLNQKSYQLSKPEIEIHVMEEMYVALCMCTCAEKTTFLAKTTRPYSGIVGGDYGYRVPSKEFSLKWPYVSLCAIFTLVLDLISYWSVKWCQAWLAFEPAEGRRKS